MSEPSKLINGESWDIDLTGWDKWHETNFAVETIHGYCPNLGRVGVRDPGWLGQCPNIHCLLFLKASLRKCCSRR